MDLKCKTREDSDYRGKPRVFFACHPDDFEECFELISGDVLDHVNCVVWYDAAMQTPDENELKEVVDEIQLLVVPVTKKMLFSPNPARDAFIPYAMERHIPLLPIMLEPKLERDFNERCGMVQIVSRYSEDATATPYDEVLETFLNSVLIGDELAEKVRNAFDAYVFLSYRKKDRRHAKRLMHLIHRNKEFREIAIWYDEFLVPGEDFNDAIRDAFNKSSLFALTVTPNLLEEGNYVLEVEYPLAHDRKRNSRGFDIVPVEMYEPEKNDPRTDIEAINDNYEEMPVVRDEHKEPEVNEAFLDALNTISRKVNDGSQQHRFFIGLAYLNGIDVEVNYDMAYEIFHALATEEEPFIDATEKLVDMYMTGDGVARSMDEAIKWQIVVANQYMEAYDKNHDPDEHLGYGTKHFRALMHLSDMYRAKGDKDAAIETAERALGFADSLMDEAGRREVERDTAVILNRLGNIYRSKREYDRAEDCYFRAKKIYERLAGEISTRRARRDLSVSCERLGDLARRKKDPDKAREYYEQAYDIRKELADSSESMGAKRDLSSAITKLGNICKDKGDLDGALRYYSKACDIDRALYGEYRTVQLTDDYCVSLIKEGDIYRKTGRNAEAIGCYEKAAEKYRKIVEESADPRYSSNLAKCMGNMASAFKHADNKEEAARCYKEQIGILENLYYKSGAAGDDTAHELAAAYFNYGIFAEDRGSIEKAAGIWGKLSAKDPYYRKYLEKAERR